MNKNEVYDASRYAALYSRTSGNTKRLYQEPYIYPELDREREVHNHESNISIWTMAENLTKLKQGDTFDNGSLVGSTKKIKREKNGEKESGMAAVSTS